MKYQVRYLTLRSFWPKHVCTFIPINKDLVLFCVCPKHFSSHSNFLSSLLGSICIWMSPATVKAKLPLDFDGPYSNTQVILDCTELWCQTPSSLLLQSEVFSTYKSHCTFKVMLGMSPNGALTFVSSLYQGSMSDKELFRQSGITALLTPEMGIMVDKGKNKYKSAYTIVNTTIFHEPWAPSYNLLAFLRDPFT